MVEIWNEVVEEGIAFPQLNTLNLESGQTFFDSQTFCGVAEEDGSIYGLYILHPNNEGRVGHIANASYAVSGHEPRVRGSGLLLRRSVLPTGGAGRGTAFQGVREESSEGDRLGAE